MPFTEFMKRVRDGRNSFKRLSRFNIANKKTNLKVNKPVIKPLIDVNYNHMATGQEINQTEKGINCHCSNGLCRTFQPPPPSEKINKIKIPDVLQSFLKFFNSDNK